MGWYLLAAVPALAFLALFLLWLLRFRYRLEYSSPDVLTMAGGVRFLWWKRDFVLDPVKLVADKAFPGPAAGASGPDAAPETVSETGVPGAGPGAEPPTDPRNPGGGQRGALRVPEALTVRMERARRRFKAAAGKWILTPAVWRLMLGYAWGSGRGMIRFLNPRLEMLHLGLENAYDLARFAAVWSAVQSTVRALACPVTYGFGVAEAELRFRVGGRFSALRIGMMGFSSLARFPFAGLLRQFLACWRDPSLKRWQKRVLLP